MTCSTVFQEHSRLGSSICCPRKKPLPLSFSALTLHLFFPFPQPSGVDASCSTFHVPLVPLSGGNTIGHHFIPFLLCFFVSEFPLLGKWFQFEGKKASDIQRRANLWLELIGLCQTDQKNFFPSGLTQSGIPERMTQFFSAAE